MPFITYDGQPLEIPRHVHQAGASIIVSSEAELRAALADGYVIDPNAAPVEPPAELPDPDPEPDEPPIVADRPDVTPPSESDLVAYAFKVLDSDAADRAVVAQPEPKTPKKRGRPRKVKA